MSRLLSPFARVTLGGRIFTWGDGRLQDVSVSLAEGDKGSDCNFTVYDPGREFIDELLAYVEEIQGLEPLEKPEPPKPVSTGVASGAGTSNGNLSANVRAALDVLALGEVGQNGGYNTKFGGGTFSSFARHPGGGPAGRYQFKQSTWNEVAAQEGLSDFSPKSQDTGALNRIKSRGSLAAIEAGNFEAALTGTGGVTGMAWEWSSMPPSRYGESRLTMSEAVAKFKEFQKRYAAGVQETTAAIESTTPPPVESTTRKASLAGSQITIEMGFNGVLLVALSYLHTSLDFSLYDTDTVKIGGQSSAWVLTQRVRNTAYKNVSFKQVAQKICSAYGLTLDMANDGPKYEYFPQRGVSDYQALLIEARRIGYRITSKGNTLTIKPRGAVEAFYVLKGENLGESFTITHSAQGTSSGGARASDPSQRTTTGQRKVKIDPDTGKQEIIKAENLVGAGVSPEQSTTGAAIVTTAPKTTGETDAVDAVRKDNETRVKGIEATFTAPTTPELLTVDPDSAISTEGISEQIDRIWVIESISHSLSSSGFSTTGSIYSPLKNRYPQPAETLQSSGLSTVSGEIPNLNPNGFIKPTTGVVTSGFRPPNRPRHSGVDIANNAGTPIWAPADGIVSIPAFDGGGYGNAVFITHGDGYISELGHMSQIKATSGQQVKQGDVVGLMGTTGSSTGNHLHWTVRVNGVAVNPATLVKL